MLDKKGMRKRIKQSSTSYELRERDVKGDIYRNIYKYKLECNVSHEQGKNKALTWVGMAIPVAEEPLG